MFFSYEALFHTSCLFLWNTYFYRCKKNGNVIYFNKIASDNETWLVFVTKGNLKVEWLFKFSWKMAFIWYSGISRFLATFEINLSSVLALLLSLEIILARSTQVISSRDFALSKRSCFKVCQSFAYFLSHFPATITYSELYQAFKMEHYTNIFKGF